MGGTGWGQVDPALRVLIVETRDEAATILREIERGRTFDSLARERSLDASAVSGGYLGRVPVASLRPEYREAIAGLGPGEISPVTVVGDAFAILTLVGEGEAGWLDSQAVSRAAAARGELEAAADAMARAVDEAERLWGDGPRLAQSLNDLAEIRRAQENWATARPLYSRALSMIRRAFGPSDPNVVAVLTTIADLDQALGEDARAAALYREYFEERWGRRNGERAGVNETLDQFTTLLNTASFSDGSLRSARNAYLDGLAAVPLEGELYVAIGERLLSAGFVEEAEVTLRRAVAEFPASRAARYSLAQLLRDTARPGEAASVLDQALALPPAQEGTATDIEQRAFLELQLGASYTDLLRFDDALAAYERGLELDPDHTALRLARGHLMLLRNQTDGAVAEFERAVRTEPQSAATHAGLALAYQRSGQHDAAVRAAREAIRLDPADLESRYVLGIGLVRMGRQEEGQTILAAYRELEAQFSRGENRIEEATRLSQRAAERFVEGSTDEALELLAVGVADYPDVSLLGLNLAVALSKSGLHEAAAEVLEHMVGRGLGDHFLVDWNRAQVSRQIGDPTWIRHEVSYLGRLLADLTGEAN